MAADADTPELSAEAAIHMSPPSMCPADEGAVKSALDAEKSVTPASLEMAKTENDRATVDDEVADGFNWKGDANATFSGQSVPQYEPGEKPPPSAPPGQALPGQPKPASPPPGQPPPASPAGPATAVAPYDPAAGAYIGPDGQMSTQSNLANGAGKERTWQQLLIPPTGN